METAQEELHPLRVAREAKGMSRIGLAFRAGVSLKTVEQIEAGKAQPRVATQRVLAAALDLDPAELGWPQEAAA
jgi:transcriptional regulator with XRE-family HTH domain